MYNFVEQDALSPRDYLAVGAALLILGLYHLYVLVDTRRMHRSLPGSVGLQRVWWSRQVYDDVREKITSIQNFRSTMMILSFYSKVVLIGAAASAELGVQQINNSVWTASRGLVPAGIFLMSLVNMVICAQALYFLHFHCMLEPGVASPTNMAVAGASADDGGAEINGLTDFQMKKSKLHITSLICQFAIHFRIAQRLMIIALVFMLWAIEPILMLSCVVVLTFQLYYNDYPFPAEYTERVFGIADGVPPDSDQQTLVTIREEEMTTQSTSAHTKDGVPHQQTDSKIYFKPVSPVRSGEGVRRRRFESFTARDDRVVGVTVERKYRTTTTGGSGAGGRRKSRVAITDPFAQRPSLQRPRLPAQGNQNNFAAFEDSAQPHNVNEFFDESLNQTLKKSGSPNGSRRTSRRDTSGGHEGFRAFPSFHSSNPSPQGPDPLAAPFSDSAFGQQVTEQPVMHSSIREQPVNPAMRFSMSDKSTGSSQGWKPPADGAGAPPAGAPPKLLALPRLNSANAVNNQKPPVGGRGVSFVTPAANSSANSANFATGSVSGAVQESPGQQSILSSSGTTYKNDTASEGSMGLGGTARSGTRPYDVRQHPASGAQHQQLHRQQQPGSFANPFDPNNRSGSPIRAGSPRRASGGSGFNVSTTSSAGVDVAAMSPHQRELYAYHQWLLTQGGSSHSMSFGASMTDDGGGPGGAISGAGSPTDGLRPASPRWPPSGFHQHSSFQQEASSPPGAGGGFGGSSSVRPQPILMPNHGSSNVGAVTFSSDTDGNVSSGADSYDRYQERYLSQQQHHQERYQHMQLQQYGGSYPPQGADEYSEEEDEESMESDDSDEMLALQ